MTSDRNNSLIDIDSIYEMLFNEKKYVIEFAEASIQSFNEFSDHYAVFLLNRDIENLRRAGHKIKPVAQMLNVDQILVEYENAKRMLLNKKPDKDLRMSVERIQDICSKVVSEFEEIINDSK
jgi:hypothetical protein